MSLGAKIKEFGLKNFSSLGEFSEALGMSLPNLSAYIHETRGPGSPFLKKLKDLGCDLNWLFTDDSHVINDNQAIYSAKNPLKQEVKRLREENMRLKKIIDNISKNIPKD